MMTAFSNTGVKRRMLLESINTAMRQARNEIRPNDLSDYGEIPELDVVYESAMTLEKCRTEHESVRCDL